VTRPNMALLFCANFVLSVVCYRFKFAFVVFDLFSSVPAKRLAGTNVSKMTHLVSSGMKIRNSVSRSVF